ncbi:hypothetical protein ABEB36_000694 [Hypothenemus hampei]|uniref:Cilia-and flagella-associated protein 96 n=1 Tax=Hypothenemus hampei TaxID=57062 RepID=A0ABD1FE13_HYPHA
MFGKATEPLGNKYGKPDIERIGLFSEMSYMNGKGYVPLFERHKLEKGKNMLAGGPKVKCDWQDCYFDKEFKRIFTGEALRGRGRKPKPLAFKNISERPFIPPSNMKWHSTPGDWYGTFQGNIEAFGNKLRPRPPFKSDGPNAFTSPGKKGGYGYANICLNPYPEHSVEKYGIKPKYKQHGHPLDGPLVVGMYPKAYFEVNPYKDPDKLKPGPTYIPPKERVFPVLPPGKFIPTGPGKLPGGCKAGCFDKYPEHKADKLKPIRKSKGNLAGIFYPPAYGDKTFYTCSVINENLRFRINEKNYDSYRPTFTKHLL